MRSRPTTISPEKFFRMSSVHMASVIEGSSPGTKWLSTSVLTPASAATRPNCSVVVWLSRRCLRNVGALGWRPSRRSRPARVHDLVHQHVGALGERDQLRRIGGVAREYDGAA